MPEDNVTKAPTFGRYRVMVAEDDPQGAKLISMVLRKLGFEDIHMAEDGLKARDMFENTTQAFKLVISDWNMPGMTGLELLQHVRQTNSSLPFIMITGRGMMESAVDAKMHGVTHFIHKPYTPQQLIGKIRDALAEE